ncbi:MAG TPA: DUF4129 domain-containing protein [Motilibacterales bacterium]|nr:DUF4129 domain-containing protein [Motilibacterales bacterium]
MATVQLAADTLALGPLHTSAGIPAGILADVPTGIPADVPVDLTREQAQRLAELELSDPAYRAGQPGLIERAITWLVEWVQRIADRAADAAPGGWLGILGLVLLVVVAVLFIRWRIGPVSRSAGLAFTVDPGTSAAQYRARAEELATAGEWDEAVSERMRALVRAGQERGLIDTHPGWTADEVAESVSDRVPEARDLLSRASRTFDEVRYGGRPGSPAAYRAVAEADDRVTTGTPLQPAQVKPSGRPSADAADLRQAPTP